MIIEVDDYKNKIPGYDPNKSEYTHSESGRLADIDFKSALQSKKYKRIIFMAGGTASGKTEYAYSYLNKKDQLVYDGTLKDYEGFRIKLQKIERYDKNKSRIKIVAIVPLFVEKSIEAFLGRDRKMPMFVFFETHVKSLVTVAKILEETSHRVEIYVSSVKVETGKLTYVRLKIKNRRSTAVLLKNLADIVLEIGKKNSFGIN